MLRMAEAAEYLGFKLRTFERHYTGWQVPNYRVGKIVLFRVSEIEAWLQGRKEI